MILVGTDFHGEENAFRNFASKAEEAKADILVICGDVTHFGSIHEARNLLSLLTRLRLPVLFVPGNCDPPFLAEVEMDGAYSLHGRLKSIGDLTFLGIGGSSITPFSTPFEMTEEEIWKLLCREADRFLINRWFILVSHTPPKNTKADKNYAGRHIGSESVRRFVEEKKPSIVLCGHVHEAPGVDKINSTIVVNPGPARHGKCALVSVNEEIEVKLDNL